MKNNIDNLEIIQSYPLFKANQVLRENQLNDIVKYLEQQDRLSRICLMGTGIVCGLEARWDDDNNAIYVSAGTGVTSEGYLVKAGSKYLNAYKWVSLDLKWFGTNEERLTLEEGYTPPSRVIELVHESEEIADLDGNDLSDKISQKVLVLVFHREEGEDEGLCGNDCDEKGKFQSFRTRFILIEEELAYKILQATYDPNSSHISDVFANIHELFYHKFSALHPVIERFGFNEVNNNKTVRLNDISSYEEFRNRYRLIINLLASRLDGVFNQVNKVFSPVFTPTLKSNEKLVEENLLSEKIKDLLSNGWNELNIQYVHDYLCDLVHAYEELMEAVYDLVADCPPNLHHYPKFLWLKGFLNNEANEAFSIYRTPYTQPPIYNGNKSRLSETITLYERLKTLVQGDVFQVPENRDSPEIRITPSKTDFHSISQRAVPFYYNRNQDVVRNWSPRLKRLGKAGNVYSYHRPEGKPFEEPLTYRMEGSDFLRVEGHIGMQFHDVIRDLTDLRQRYNLSFEMVSLKIGAEFDDDLFQFICKDLDCERRNYVDQYARLRTRVFSAFPEGDMHEQLFQLLPEELADFNDENFAQNYDGLIEQYQRHGLPSSGNFLQIYSCYQELMVRWERTKKKHLFHHFALEHPGMKHRGGVPIGGTLILAYVDLGTIQPSHNRAIESIGGAFSASTGREIRVQEIIRSRVIVADFYLPYSCVSCCPTNSIIAERPRPALSVSPSVFCEGDVDPTELEIRVQPEGGLISGPGYRFAEGRHLLTPSETGVSEGNVELKYFVDGGEATYLLTIVKLPDVDFNIVDENGNTASEICQNSGRLLLGLATGVSGGQFEIFVGDEDLTDLLNLDDNGNYFLDPMELPVGTEEPMILEIRYTVEGNLCGNQFTQELTIFPVPDAAFLFEGELNEVCADMGRIEIIPNQQGGNFTGHIDDGEPIQGLIFQEEGRWYINLSTINLRFGQSVQVIIRHNINTEHGCGNSAEQLLTIWSIQETDFNLPERACQSDQPFILDPQPSGGVFDYSVSGDLDFENLIEDGQFFPGRVQAETSVSVTVAYSISIGACEGSQEKTIEILPAPKMDFQARFVSRIRQPNAPFAVIFEGIQHKDAEEYSWNSNSGNLTRILNESFGNILPQEPVSFEQDFEGELWVELSVREGICQSETIRRQVLPAVDSFTLIIASPDIIVTTPNSNQTIYLHDGIVIPIFRFREQLFFIRASTMPYPADSVEIELEHEGESMAVEMVEYNEGVNGFDLKNENGFEPNTGSYLLRATPFAKLEDGSDLAGETMEINFSIMKGETDRENQPSPPVSEFPEEVVTFLRRRDSAYRTELEELRADTSLVRTTSFEKAEAFLSSQFESENFEKQYFDLMDTLERAANRTESGGERQKEFFKLMEITTKHFMDREVVKSPDNVSEDIIQTMVSKIENMEKAGFDRGSLIENWAGESLKKKLNASSVDLFGKALKPK